MAETLGSRLRAAMKKAGMKNYELAEAAGVHTITISKWREDKQIPEAAALDRAAAVLGVSPAWLRYGTETPPPIEGRMSATAPMATIGGGMVREVPASLPSEYPQRVRAMIRPAIPPVDASR